MTGRDQSDDDPVSEEDGIIRAEFDWSSHTPCEAVVETVAIAANVGPTTLDPLYESVDPDALDALIRPDGMGPKNGDVTLAFEYAGQDVTIRSDGVLVVRPDR